MTLFGWQASNADREPPRQPSLQEEMYSTSVEYDRPATLASFEFPEYRNVFTAGVLIFVAVQAQTLARGQLAFDLTGSNAGLGGVYLGFGIPMLIFTPLGGVASDRLPKRTVLLIAQSCLVLSAIWVAGAAALDVVEYWMLVGAGALQGGGFALFGPARVAYTSELVPKHLLGNAVALTQVSLSATRVLAPASAGILIAIDGVGTTGVFVVTSAVMAVALAVTSRLPRSAGRALGPSPSLAAAFTVGVRYAWHTRLLRLLIGSSFVMVMSAWPHLAFLPAVANEMYDEGATGLGILSSVSAIAALSVMVWIAARSRPNQVWRIQMVAGIVLGIGLLGVAASPNFAWCVAAIFVVGGAASAYQSMNNTIVLMVTDLEFHGRVQSLLMLSFSGFALAALPLGVVADSVGLRTTLTAMGGTCLVTMFVYALLQRRLRRAGGELDFRIPPG